MPTTTPTGRAPDCSATRHRRRGDEECAPARPHENDTAERGIGDAQPSLERRQVAGGDQRPQRRIEYRNPAPPDRVTLALTDGGAMRDEAQALSGNDQQAARRRPATLVGHSRTLPASASSVR
jgi:hypothetical protein